MNVEKKVSCEKGKSEAYALWRGLDVNYLIGILIPNWEMSSLKTFEPLGTENESILFGNTSPPQGTP